MFVHTDWEPQTLETLTTKKKISRWLLILLFRSQAKNANLRAKDNGELNELQMLQTNENQMCR